MAVFAISQGSNGFVASVNGGLPSQVLNAQDYRETAKAAPPTELAGFFETAVTHAPETPNIVQKLADPALGLAAAKVAP